MNKLLNKSVHCTFAYKTSEYHFLTPNLSVLLSESPVTFNVLSKQTD